MSFFDKAKRALNIGGAKIEIASPGILGKGQAFALQATVTGGKIDQKITGATAKLQQKSTASSYGLNGGKSTSSKTYVINEAQAAGFDLKAGETKQLSFDMNVAVPEDGAAQEGMMGTLNKLNKMATGAKEEYSLEVTLMIDGSADTSDSIEVQLQ